MCRTSSAKGVTKQWCGAGLTGQPTVHLRDGRTWVVFDGYDGAVQPGAGSSSLCADAVHPRAEAPFRSEGCFTFT